MNADEMPHQSVSMQPSASRKLQYFAATCSSENGTTRAFYMYSLHVYRRQTANPDFSQNLTNVVPIGFNGYLGAPKLRIPGSY